MKDSLDSFEWISEMLDNNQEHLVADKVRGDARAERESRIITATRAAVRSRSTALRMQAPVSLERSIRMAIAAEARTQSGRSFTGKLRGMLSSFATQPRYAAAALAFIAVAASTLFVLSQRGDTLPSNMTEAALAAYANVSSDAGNIDLHSSDKNDLRAFFANHGVDLEVFFPTVAAELVGGSVRSINGRDFPVLVYRTAGRLISLLEVEQGAIDAKTVELDRATAEDVSNSKWHWASSQDRTLFVWKSNSIMCSVVSDLAVNEVSALFSLEVL
ncbi:MAG: hypothetical protein ACK6C4_00365 [Bacteroidota bacterium]